MNTEVTKDISEMSNEELAESYVEAIDAANGFRGSIKEYHQILNKFEEEVAVTEEQEHKINKQIEDTQEQLDQIDKVIDELRKEVDERDIDPYELLR